MSDSKSKQIVVEVERQPPEKAVFANHFCIEAGDDHWVFHFGYRTDLCECSESTSIALSLSDVRIQIASFQKYLQDISAFVNAEDLPSSSRPRFLSPKTINAANILQLARTGSTAETTFSVFVIHDLVVGKKGHLNDALMAKPKVLIRSSLQLQFELICEMLKLLPHDEQ